MQKWGGVSRRGLRRIPAGGGLGAEPRANNTGKNIIPPALWATGGLRYIGPKRRVKCSQTKKKQKVL